MMAGLSRDPPETLGCLRPPLSLPRIQNSSPVAHKPSPPSLVRAVIPQGSKTSYQDKKQLQKRNKRIKSRKKDGEAYSSSGEDSAARLSSDSETSSGASNGSGVWHRSYNTSTGAKAGSSKFGARRGKGCVSGSESDISDSEASKLKSVMCKIRLEAHTSLALLFQVRRVASV